MIKKYIRILAITVILAMTILPIQVLAATTLTSPATNLAATVDGSSGAYSGTGASGTVSMTVTGGSILSKNGTLTLTNSGSEAARLSFAYSVSGNYSEFTVAGSTGSSSGGTYDAELAAGSSVAIYLKCSSKKTATVSLTNIKLEVASSANVTINHNELGTVSVGGTVVTSGDTVGVDAAGATFAASPISGATFVGWINTADNSVVSTATSFTYIPTGDASVTAVFTKATEEAWFLTAGKAYLVQGLDAAISSASSASGKVIILAASGTVSSGNYTIPSGVSLLAPFDSDGTIYTTSPGYVKDSYTKPSVFRTLTLASGANITIADGGAISVSAKVSAKMGYAGAPTSKYGHIALNSGSSITVQSGGKLYVWGFITGSGTVNLKSGATAYESFQVVDWRGGTASSGMLGNSNKVFLMTQYYVQNVEAPMVMESGAKVTCSMIADIISVRTVEVQFLGTSGCIFNLTSGSVTKRYDGSTDRLILDINGEFTISQTEIELVQYLYSIDLSDYVLPINSNVTLNVNSGTLTLNQDTSLLPGVQVNIAEGGTLKLNSGKRLFVYDETEWKGGYYVYNNAYFRPVNYAHSKAYTRSPATDIVDAKILVNGTLDASAGYLYSTSSGGNICSTGSGVVKTQTGESSPTLYEATQSGTSISYATISVGAGQLKHGDGTYLPTAAGTYNYNNEHGKWVLGDHTITDEVTDPTCTEKGYTTHTCACGYSYTDSETDAVGHTLTKTDAVDATCTDAGNSEYWQCETCKLYFGDAEGATQIEENSWVIAAKGHTYGEVTYEWTNYTACVATRSCSCDHSETANATISSAVTTAATCTATGVRTYTATFSADWASTQTTTETIAIDENAHTWDNDCDTECNDCGTTRTITHSYESVVTAPTCEAQGYTTHTCSACGESYKDTYVDATGHSYTVEQSSIDATCVATGSVTWKCANCDSTKTETLAINGSNHTGNNTTGVNAKDATCTVNGYTGDTVCECGVTVASGSTIPATGHTEATAVKENEKAATCTAEGSYDEVVYCSECGEELSRETKTTEKVAHTEGTAVVENEVHETCTTDGSYDSVVYCTVCSTELSRTSHTVASTGHQNTTTTTVDATCTADGSVTVTCDDCGTTVSTETIKAAGHDYKTVVTDPTCTAAGYTTYTCSVCGDSYTADVVEANGHSYNAGVVTTSPTCTAEGVKTFTCGTCGDTYTEAVEANGHSYNAVVTNPTCEDKGYTTYTCACGDSYVADYVDAKGHDYSSEVTTHPTCTEKGIKTYTCQNDSAHTYTEEVAANGHTEGEAVTENNVAATCTEDGSYDTVIYCTVCEAEVSRKTTVVEATGHTEGEVVVENKVEATCGAAGSYDNVVYCSVCGEELSRETVTVAATGAHNYGEPQFTWNDYECSAKVVCTCGEEQDVAVIVTSEVTTAATCTVNGVETYTATAVYGGQTYTSDEHPTKDLGLDSSNHVNTKIVAEQAATCTEGGYTAGTYCEDCHKWISGHEEIKALDHNWTVSYSWTDEGKTCTATRACGNDESHNVTETVTASGTVKTDATCLAKGWTTYTAEFTADWAENQTKDVQDIAQLAHSYTGAIKSDGDGKDATHSYKCVNGCEAYGNATAHTWNEGEQTKAPTCTDVGEQTYTCTADGCGATYTEEVAANGHKYESVVTAPTCTEAGYTTHICSVCDDSYTDSKVTATGHTYSEVTYSGDGKTAYKAERKCNCGDTQTATATITSEVTKTATCTESGVRTYIANFTEDWAVDKTTTEEIAKLDHSYGTDWKYDTTNHWHECSCGAKSDEAAHTYTSEVTKAATCTEAGETTYTCTCGHSYTEAIDATGHQNTVTINTKEATCGEAGYTGDTYCNDCKTTIETGTAIAATGNHSDSETDNDHNCDVCGESVGGHSYGEWVTIEEATCVTAGSRQKTCNCGDVVTEEIAATNVHSDSETDKDHICDTCDNVMSECSGGSATCTAKAVCTTCGAEYGELAAHTPGEAVEENRVESTCTVAGSCDSVVYCSVCDAELSRETVTVDALGHKYESVVTDPTCTEAGYTTYTCSVCGDTYTGNNVTANGHSYENGTCTVCGEADPDYSVGVTVSFVNYTVTGKTPATISVGGTAVSTTTQAVGVSATLGIDRTFIVESTQSVVVAYTTNGTDYTEIPVSDVANTYVLPDEATGDIRIAVAFCGDGNLDGALDGKDITLIRRDILTEGTYLSGLKRIAADIKLDDVLDGKDITMIRRYILSNT